jgi:predicted permease
MAMQVVRNPLILSCVGGLALNVLGIGLPAGVGPILRALGQGAVALGLMAVGAALTLGALTARPLLQLAVLGIKLVLVPAVVWGAGLVFGLSGAALSVAVLFMGLPTASSSYIMARQMGGDAPLMAALTTTEHLAAVLTLPVWIALLR